MNGFFHASFALLSIYPWCNLQAIRSLRLKKRAPRRSANTLPTPYSLDTPIYERNSVLLIRFPLNDLTDPFMNGTCSNFKCFIKTHSCNKADHLNIPLTRCLLYYTISNSVVSHQGTVHPVLFLLSLQEICFLHFRHILSYFSTLQYALSILSSISSSISLGTAALSRIYPRPCSPKWLPS